MTKGAVAYIKEQEQAIRKFAQSCSSNSTTQHFIQPIMSHSVFTHSQRTEKNYTVGAAIKQATEVLAKHYNLTGVCVNKVQHVSQDKPITLNEMSDLIEDLVNDTIYHAGGWH